MKQKRSLDTQERIINAALDIYRERGSIQIPVTLLSERSKSSVGSIYHHFGNMEGVATAVYMACLGSLFDAITKGIAGAVNISLAVKKIVNTYLMWTLEHPHEARFIHASFAAPFISHYMKSTVAWRDQRIGELHGRVMELVPNNMKKIPPSLIEILIIGPVAETARRWLSGEQGVDLRLAAKVLPGYILAGIMKSS